MKSYVNRQTSTLLRRLSTQIREAEKLGTPDSVHDLRTGIRRLSECLQTFEAFFPDGEAGRLRRELKKLMRLAGDVRNRDVADKLFSKSGEPQGEKLKAKLESDHKKAKAALAAKLKKWADDDFPRRCRSELNL